MKLHCPIPVTLLGQVAWFTDCSRILATLIPGRSDVLVKSHCDTCVFFVQGSHLTWRHLLFFLYSEGLQVADRLFSHFRAGRQRYKEAMLL